MPEVEVQKRATARPQVYIEVALADGQNFLFDITTATELKNELGLALASLNPPKLPSERKRQARLQKKKNGK